jgi:RNA polymerase sigma-70 factor (ECF subfamily)
MRIVSQKFVLLPSILTSALIALIMNEDELKVQVEKMKAGDREAFNKLFRRYYTPLVRFGVRFVADADQSAEIVQDLFVKLWTGREKLTVNSSFESYMLRSVRNAAITYINKERVHAEVNERIFTDDSDANDPSETLQSNNLESSYRAILANMPEKRREVFLASRYDGLKYAEIANKMGLSQKTVEAHMSAAIKQLKEGLKAYL